MEGLRRVESQMILWSLLAAVVGVLATWYGMLQIARTDAERPPEAFWLLGLAALLPAWLIPFLGLLGRLAERRPDKAVAVWWILSAAAALCGAIATHARIRRLQTFERPFSPRTHWRVGLVTLVPAWGLAVLGLVFVLLGQP